MRRLPTYQLRYQYLQETREEKRVNPSGGNVQHWKTESVIARVASIEWKVAKHCYLIGLFVVLPLYNGLFSVLSPLSNRHNEVLPHNSKKVISRVVKCQWDNTILLQVQPLGVVKLIATERTYARIEIECALEPSHRRDPLAFRITCTQNVTWRNNRTQCDPLTFLQNRAPTENRVTVSKLGVGFKKKMVYGQSPTSRLAAGRLLNGWWRTEEKFETLQKSSKTPVR